jgi:hypothetical protein
MGGFSLGAGQPLRDWSLKALWDRGGVKLSINATRFRWWSATELAPEPLSAELNSAVLMKTDYVGRD